MDTNTDDKTNDSFPVLTDISNAETYLIECFRAGLKDKGQSATNEDNASYLAAIKNVLAAFEEMAPYYVQGDILSATLDTLSTAKDALSATLDGQE